MESVKEPELVDKFEKMIIKVKVGDCAKCCYILFRLAYIFAFFLAIGLLAWQDFYPKVKLVYNPNNTCSWT